MSLFSSIVFQEFLDDNSVVSFLNPKFLPKILIGYHVKQLTKSSYHLCQEQTTSGISKNARSTRTVRLNGGSLSSVSKT